MQIIDDSDRHILRLMQHDPTASVVQLAHQTGLTKASCWRRVERMQTEGIIIGRAIQIDPKALGYEVEVSLRITLEKTAPNAFDAFIAQARKVPQVNEIQTFLGRVDVRLNIHARDMAHYQDIYRTKILALPHINDIEALMLVANVKNSNVLPL